jgi:arsenical pump membrane protein
MPSLAHWFEAFALPALIAIAVTFGMLVWRFSRDLRGRAEHAEVADVPPPSRAGVALLAGSALTLIAVSAREGPLGAATFACAAAVWLFALARRRDDALAIVRQMDWRIVPLTAALFVIVAAIDAGGALEVARAALLWCAQLPFPGASLAAGTLAGLASNAVNNLPVALAAGETLPVLAARHPIAHAVLVGVNLGPNLSANGSLATILWLGILRRNGIVLSGRAFVLIGLAIAPPALLAALLAVR